MVVASALRLSCRGPSRRYFALSGAGVSRFSVVLDDGDVGVSSRGWGVVLPVAAVYPIQGEGGCSLGSVGHGVIWLEWPLCGAAWSLMSRANRFIG